MNPSLISDEQLDRLVDGELSREQHVELLRALEQAPDGWRRCALAFLESQVWRVELRRESTVSPRESPSVTAIDRRPPPSPRRSPLWLAAAAAVGAFVLGNVWDRVFTSTPRNASPARGGVLLVDGEPSRNEAPLSLPTPARPLAGDSQFVLLDATDGSVRRLSLPVVDEQDPVGRWVIETPAEVPPFVQHATRKLGLEWAGERHWADTVLPDGRQVVVPVDEFQVRPVANRVYQ